MNYCYYYLLKDKFNQKPLDSKWFVVIIASNDQIKYVVWIFLVTLLKYSSHRKLICYFSNLVEENNQIK